jgi:hypothetical protein
MQDDLGGLTDDARRDRVARQLTLHGARLDHCAQGFDRLFPAISRNSAGKDARIRS